MISQYLSAFDIIVFYFILCFRSSLLL